MFQVHIQNPRVAQWQTRLARVPRWAWLAFFIGAVLPAVALVIFLLITFLFTGVLVMAAVIVAVTLFNTVRRLVSRRNNRPGNMVVVRSVRVIDP